jgi:hypothetical protein
MGVIGFRAAAPAAARNSLGQETSNRRRKVLGPLLGVLALAAAVGRAEAGVEVPFPTLPPQDGAYVTPSEVHACFAAYGYCLVRGSHFGFDLPEVIFPPEGQHERFRSTFSAQIFTDIGGSPGVPVGPLSLTGPVEVTIFGRTFPTELGTFATEMTALDLSGDFAGHSVAIRGDPDQRSMGQTSLTDIGGGLFRIDSFFDVFAQLSIDGGPFVGPDSGLPTRVDLVPEPGSLGLLGAGLVLLALRRKRSVGKFYSGI